MAIMKYVQAEEYEKRERTHTISHIQLSQFSLFNYAHFGGRGKEEGGGGHLSSF